MKIIIRNNNATDTFSYSFGDPADAMVVGSLVALCGVAGIMFGLFGCLVAIGGYIVGTGVANWHAQTRTTKAVEDALAEVQSGAHVAKPSPGWVNPHVVVGGKDGNGQ